MRRLPYSRASLGGSGNILPRFVSKSFWSGASGVEARRGMGSVAADFKGLPLENAIGHLGRVFSLAHVATSFGSPTLSEQSSHVPSINSRPLR